MINVMVPNNDKYIEFDCPACSVDDGALIIYSDPEGMAVTAGFAPGAWAAFEIKKE